MRDAPKRSHKATLDSYAGECFVPKPCSGRPDATPSESASSQSLCAAAGQVSIAPPHLLSHRATGCVVCIHVHLRCREYASFGSPRVSAGALNARGDIRPTRTS